MDQLNAAISDAINRFRAQAPKLVVNGQANFAYLNVPDRDRTKIGGAVRQVMAAESVGLLSLCRHTQQIRPQVLLCDPPVIIWNHECDRCGVRADKLTPVAIGGLGFITVSGHVCNRCAAEDRRQAAQHVDQVLLVGNRRARRRGGAR